MHYRESYSNYVAIATEKPDTLYMESPSIFISSNSRSTQVIAQKYYYLRLNDKQVIGYLEDKIKHLEKTLSNLRQYCGEDYIEASKELEEFLKLHRFQ